MYEDEDFRRMSDKRLAERLVELAVECADLRKSMATNDAECCAAREEGRALTPSQVLRFTDSRAALHHGGRQLTRAFEERARRDRPPAREPRVHRQGDPRRRN